MSLYPVNLNIQDRLCLVVGGGPVALRKTKNLISCGATVRVISPHLGPDLKLLARRREIEWFERGYVEGDLKGVFMVFAATDDRNIQRLIDLEAAKYSVLLNSADDPGNSDFHVPAQIRRGKMLITISTGGGSPALAKRMRHQLEQEIVPEYAAVVDLLALIRDEVVGQDEDTSAHSELFHNLIQNGVVEHILKRQWFDLQMMLLEVLPETVDSAGLVKQLLEIHDKSEN